VSSILNALKKVEANGAAEDPRGPQAPHQMKALPLPRPGSRWYSRRRVLYAMAAVFLAAGAAAYYYNWSGAGGSSKTEGIAREVRSRLPSDQIAPQPAPPPAKPAPAPPAASAQKPREKPEGQPPAGRQAKASPPVQAPPPSSRIRPSEGGGPAPETRPPSASKSIAPQDRAGAGRPAASRSPEDSLSRLEESKLKVMAIAWFEDPARRLAVVNGHIVKEGESVEGYSITKIRKDDIIVNDGSRSWRVELNLKNKS
jgi:hypothetical protein